MPPREISVLVVEDEPRMRDLLADVIPEMGFPVTATRSAEEALRAMTTQPHDVAILDLNLPAMGGMDLFDVIRQRWPQTQVIVLTGFGDLEAARRAIHLDVVEFLSKPCHLRDIELALDRARRRLERLTETVRPLHVASHVDDPPTKLADVEKREILQALDRTGGNRTRAAIELGISRRKLHYRLAQYGITM